MDKNHDLLAVLTGFLQANDEGCSQLLSNPSQTETTTVEPPADDDNVGRVSLEHSPNSKEEVCALSSTMFCRW